MTFDDFKALVGLSFRDPQAADAVQPVYEQFAGTPELKSLIERAQATQ